MVNVKVQALFVDSFATGETTARCLYAELGALWAPPVFF